MQMRTIRGAAIVLAFLSSSWAGGAERKITLEGHEFTVPDGFEITLVAKTPLVDRPITADFDEHGRLYVTDSSGSNDKVDKQLVDRPHRIMCLEDTDGDGVFDQSHVFADKMMFPEGTLWHQGSLYVTAPPSIWKLTDTDGDGVADEREEWFQGKTLTGCANDLHGPYLGPDGWIYWCKGAFAEQNYSFGGKPWKTKASHIFRCRADGSGLEPVMTGGMDNPVDTVFLQTGERIFTTTFLVHPGNGQRDGLIHAIYGGVYGKDHGALEGHPRTGELMPVLAHMGAAAPCGLVCYESPSFGRGFQQNLFACQFNKHKVSRHVLSPQGGSYVSEDSDFVVSSNLDFHPTDIVEDADGSLLIVDTGGWYKLCCPTSQLHKPDILGAIYRMRRTDAPLVADPRGLKLAWKEATLADLENRLTDPRPAVKRRALREFAGRRDTGEMKQHVAQLAKTPLVRRPSRQAIETVWALARLESAEARELIRTLLAHQDDAVRLAALHAVSLARDEQAAPRLVELLRAGTPATRRAAAEALGRLGSRSAITPLLEAASRATDRAVEHSITYALIEIGDAEGTAPGLAHSEPLVQRAALLALDQMPGGRLSAKQVTPLLASNDSRLRETANWIIANHVDWGGELADWFRGRLRSVKPAARAGAAGGAECGQDSPQSLSSDADQAAGTEQLRTQLARFATHPAIQELLATSVVDASLPTEARRVALQAMADARPAELPVLWADALAKVIRTAGEKSNADSGEARAELAAAVRASRQIPPPKNRHAELNGALLAAAGNASLDEQLRLDALAAVGSGLEEVGDDQFAFLVAHLSADQSVVARSAAADSLAKARLGTSQLRRLTEVLQKVGPLELDRLLAPFERSTDEQLGLELLAALRTAASISSLRIDSLKQKLAKYSATVQEGVDRLHAEVNVDAAAQKQRLEELLPSVTQGDVRRGQAVFNSTKAACIACHRFGYLGGSVGPDLTRIGGIRNDRDLLESILYPSLSFVRSYEPVVIETVDGKIHNGLIRNETAAEITLATGVNQEVKLRREEIEELRPSTVSVMPAGLDKQLTATELADLVTFLRNAK